MDAGINIPTTSSALRKLGMFHNYNKTNEMNHPFDRYILSYLAVYFKGFIPKHKQIFLDIEFP